MNEKEILEYIIKTIISETITNKQEKEIRRLLLDNSITSDKNALVDALIIHGERRQQIKDVKQLINLSSNGILTIYNVDITDKYNNHTIWTTELCNLLNDIDSYIRNNPDSRLSINGDVIYQGDVTIFNKFNLN